MKNNINIRKEGIILAKREFAFENAGVLNPAVIKEGDSVHVFYRAVSEGNFSTLGYARLDGPLHVAERMDKPFMVPESEFESHGIEDARIVKVDDLYYLTYTGYDGVNARGAYATSKSLRNFKKQGMMVPPVTYAKFVYWAEKNRQVNKNYYQNHNFYYQEADPERVMMLWDKNVVFFPRRINGNLVFLHRIRPGIQIVSVGSLDDLTPEFWKAYFPDFHQHVVMDPLYQHESRHIGSGCPPIETVSGWVLIYHGVESTDNGLVYSACAALLDLQNPAIELARLPYPLFSPEYQWERRGEVNNVVFPTGTALFGDRLFIYYGAADERIACASLSLTELTLELTRNIKT